MSCKKKSPVVSVLLLALYPTVALPSRLEREHRERPNVVLLMADDLGYGDVGFLGSQHARTPNLDQMAAAGRVLERFYSAAPVCSPTRGSVITGRHPYRYGIRSANVGHLPAAERNLAQLLGEAGYATGHFGKWHLGTLTRTEADSNRGGPEHAEHYAPPWDLGFDECFSTEAKVPTFDPMKTPGSSQPYGTAYWTAAGQKETEKLEGDDSRIIMDRVIPFVRRASERGQPFFAVVWFHAPHLPVLADAEHRAPFDELSELEQHYLGCILAMDEQIGRLRAELRELGAARDTLLWFCSDNGPEGRAGESRAVGSTGGLSGRKRSLKEGGVRVPCVIEWPRKVPAGSRMRSAASTSDIFPTVLAAVSLELPEDRPLDGIDLAPFEDGAERSQPLAFEHRGQLALHVENYKLYRKDEKQAWELFDLDADPAERHDLAELQPERVMAMADELARWRDSCKASAR